MTNEQLQKEIKALQLKSNSLTKKVIKEGSYFKYGNILIDLDNKIILLKSKLN